MPKLTPWFSSPNDILRMWRDMLGHAFSQSLELPAWLNSDTYETDSEWVCMMEIPGLTPQHEVDVRVQNGSLVVTGNSQDVRKNAFDCGKTHYQMAMSFSQVIPLPNHLQVEKLATELDGQVLTVRIPKRHRGKRHRRMHGR
ncbi:Hsp20/alpha crystallin family protein [Numidum massiliense]|uniref:Hsp20/alpha crystallin family protein n=1 Tax=Numidum massiliense TaxID=1522315 RepID=UPI0006D5A9BC|nr:Hsp20/alpha crystallin family protein [Numidum massiliense]